MGILRQYQIEFRKSGLVNSYNGPYPTVFIPVNLAVQYIEGNWNFCLRINNLAKIVYKLAHHLKTKFVTEHVRLRKKVRSVTQVIFMNMDFQKVG